MAQPAKILLTGATGFLGSRLLRGLILDGHSVVALRRRSSDLSRIVDLLPQVLCWNIDEAPAEALFEDHDVDTIIHAAVNYGRHGENEAEIAAVNVTFPLAILRAGLVRKVRWIFNLGTSAPPALNAYARAKEAFRCAGAACAAQAGAAFVHLRLEHLYGPSDDESRFIPFLARSFLGGAAHLDLTAGEQERDFIHVDDAAAAVRLLVSERNRFDAAGATFGIGAGEAVPLRRVVEWVRDLTGAQTELRFGARPYRAGEAMRSVADIAAITELGWRPRIPFDRGLRDTIAFERERMRR